MDYSCIVFDTAPTGHTLRLLQFPTTLQKGLSKLMSLKGMFGGMLTQLGSLFGAGGGENMQDQLLGKLEQLKEVIEEVNTQFKDPELTTFVCVCIPEFLSLYETERLVQELVRFEIDTNNIVINQEVGSSRLLRARVKMQEKYLKQYYELYEDFHIVKLPLLEQEVRGTEALQEFSNFLMQPHLPEERPEFSDQVTQLQDQVRQLTQKCQHLQQQLDQGNNSEG
ncbi:ATPase get3a [Trebouxia sp. C0010 RCD-2024]